MDKGFLSIVDVNRDAFASNRGYYFQYLFVLKKWIANYVKNEGCEIFTEVGDDIKEVNNNLLFTQVKCYSSKFSLNSKEIKKAIFNFFVLFLKEGDLIRDIKFVFATNSGISKNEKLLKKWINQQPIVDNILKTSCHLRIKEILDGEIEKLHKCKIEKVKLTKEQRNNINNAFHLLREQISISTLERFIESITWKFEDKSPAESIQLITKEIHVLLSNEKFKNKPVNILFDVFLSEIYRCSQNEETEKRILLSSTIDNLLQKTEKDLDHIIDKKFTSLLGSSSFNGLYSMLEKMQQTQQLHQDKIESLEYKIEGKHKNEIFPVELTSLPLTNILNIYGRDIEIEEINSILLENKNILIHGVGGIGKSSVVELFTHNFKAQYNHIVWLNVSDSFLNSIVFNEELSFNLGLQFSVNEDISFRFRTILKKLKEFEGKNLFVVNTFNEKFEIIHPLLSLKNWNIVVTSRFVFDGISSYKIKKLTEENARKLYVQYNKKNEDDKEVLKVFFEYIEYNTLFIKLIAKTVNNSLDLNTKKIVTYLKNQELDDTDLKIDIEIGNSNQRIQIYSFLDKSFELANITNEEKNILHFLALLPSNETKISDLIAICGSDYEKKNKADITNYINNLHYKGWVERDGDNINIQKIVQETIIYRTRKKQNPFLENMFFISWLTARFSEGFINNPSQSIRFLKYGESILQSIKERYRSSIYQPLLSLENEVLLIYNLNIHDANILARWKLLSERAEKQLKKGTLLGTILNNYAHSLAKQELNDEALEYFKKSIELLKVEGEKGGSQLLHALNNISMIYERKGNYEEFAEIVNESIIIRKKYNLFNDQSLSIQCNSLGVIYQKVESYKNSIIFFNLAISEHNRLPINKRNDLNLVLYINNLSYNLYVIGQREDAIKTQTKAIKIFENLNLPDNEILLMSLTLLVQLYCETGDLEKVSLYKKRMESFSSKEPI